MLIEDLKIHLNKRMGFSGITTIHYTPKEDIQIIIGTNGSGKSSIMDELHPLPSDPAFMMPGGYKTIRVSHLGRTYLLHSTYGKSNKHSFKELIDGVEGLEQNTGGTLTAQKMLVFKAFNLTPELLKIVTGRTRFTTMSPTKRRDWILKLSDNDLSLAMGLFNKFKSGHRDAVGNHRHYINRLAEESTESVSRERMDELSKMVRITSELINDLMMDRSNDVGTIPSISFELGNLAKSIDNQSKYISKSKLVRPRCTYGLPSNINAISVYLTEQQTKLEMTNKYLSSLYADKDKIIDALRIIEEEGVGGLDDLIKLTDDMETEINKLKVKSKYIDLLKDQDASELRGAFLAVRDILVDGLVDLRDNSDFHFTRDKLKEARDRLKTLDHKKGTLDSRSFKLRAQLDAYNDTVDINCPSCNVSFKPCASHIDPESINVELKLIGTKLDTNALELKETAKYVEEAHDYMGQVAVIRRIMDTNPTLSSLWDLVTEEGLFKVNPTTHVITIDRFGIELDSLREIQVLERKLNMNKDVIEGMSKLSTTGTFTDTNQLTTLDERINVAIDEIDTFRLNVAETKVFLKEITIIENNVKQLEKDFETIIGYFNELLVSFKNKAISEAVNEKQIVLANATHALNQISRMEGVIEELNREKDKAEERVIHYDLLMRLISPVDGLISKYIQNFIDVFIGDINDIVSEVWSVGLEILPCAVDSNDVTCKFPLSVMDGYLITPDISESSSGQADIIDLAFRINVVDYAGLEEMPLYLDELAPTLDEVHRENLIKYLANLMEEKVFNQMFMISHYGANHYAFPNTEVFMIDSRNIINKPKEYNQHVVLTYRADAV